MNIHAKLAARPLPRHSDGTLASSTMLGGYPIAYFLADTFDEAVKSARTKYPSRLSHTIRIGHSAAFHIGVLQR
jgi:hypothetical protein